MRTLWTLVTLVCVALWCPIATSSDASDGTLDGSVVDATENAPIPYAFVFVHARRGADRTLRVGSHGEFHVELTPGIYDVFVAASGFSPTCKAVSIRGGETVQFSPKLRADSEHLVGN